MRCPWCGHADDKVVDSRSSEGGSTIRRRRECIACHRRFTTFERTEVIGLTVVKRDGAKEPFELDWNRLVIFKGITIHGIIGRRMYQTWYQMDNLLRSGRLDIRPAITHVMPMEKIEDAIGLLRDGRAGKVVLVPWGEKG